MITHSIDKRLTHEVRAALSLHDKRGQSKHAAKQAARAQAQRERTSYTQITGLYATSSYTTYAKQAMTALRWIAERYGCKRLNECRQYLPAYYAEMQVRGLSAWTIRTRVYRCARFMALIIQRCLVSSICPPATVLTSSAGGKSARQMPGTIRRNRKLCARLPAPAGRAAAGFWG